MLLTLNAGSSSLKFALFEMDELKQRAHGQIEKIGTAPRMTATDAGGDLPTPDFSADLSYEALLGRLLHWLDDHLQGGELAAVGHRIVHGGLAFDRPVLLDDDRLADLEALCPLAPLHQPHNLAAAHALREARPDLPQVGCFDTAFHHGQAEVVTRFALPPPWRERGVRRYGFHGLSYEYVSARLRDLDPVLASGRAVIAHLGNGASLCAVHEGRSVDTTMGFTALDGLMMGTRCGALDPGVVLYLQAAGLTVEALQTLLYEQSGLLGVSQVSADMRVLLASDDPRAEEAIDLFTFRIAREFGALASSMGGVDGIVFTAGIGEHAPEIRARVCERLAWLGCELDPEANAAGEGLISAPSAKLKVWVIPTDEEAMIARHTAALIGQGARYV